MMHPRLHREGNGQRESGIALVTAILLLLLISLTIVNTIEFSGNELASSGRTRATGKNLYAADAGVQLGLQRITPPRDLSAFTFTLSDGTRIESRERGEATPQPIEELGVGAPPEGYSINVGSGYVNELFELDVTATATNGSVTQLSSKLSSLQPNSGAY